jgi:hypothetical protein
LATYRKGKERGREEGVSDMDGLRRRKGEEEGRRESLRAGFI